MRTTILTVLFLDLVFFSIIEALGINCRGSIVCTQSFDTVSKLSQAVVHGTAGAYCPGGPISDLILWKTGRHIACISYPSGAGSICLFMQGNVPAWGIPGNVIKERLRDLVKHGCTSCGSVPLSGDNEPDELGILTVNFVAQPQCRGVCYPDWTATA